MSPTPPNIIPPAPSTYSTSSSYGDLITPELIARARESICLAPQLKYAEVINALYTVKLGPGVSDYEYQVLQFLDTIPHVPTPRPIDFFDIEVPFIHWDPSIKSAGTEVWHVIVMSTIPGEHSGRAGQSMEQDEVVKVLAKVKDHMAEINSIITSGGATFPDIDGNWTPLIPAIDFVSDLDCHRGHTIQLPFYNAILDGSVHFKDFISTMSKSAPQPPDTAKLLTSILTYLGPGQSSDVRFCHMDLQDRNIMVHNGQLSGIVDWEFAGWYTWHLEVLGGIRRLRGWTFSLYVEAWELPNELVATIRSLYTIRRGMGKFRIAEMERDAERAREARMLSEKDFASDRTPEQSPTISQPESYSLR